MGNKNLFFSINERSFSKISLKVISSGPTNSIIFSLISSLIILVIEFVKSEQCIGLAWSGADSHEVCYVLSSKDPTVGQRPVCPQQRPPHALPSRQPAPEGPIPTGAWSGTPGLDSIVICVRIWRRPRTETPRQKCVQHPKSAQKFLKHSSARPKDSS